MKKIISKTKIPASIIIVEKNSIDTISLLLDSLLKQTNPDFEVLVFDGNSIDGTWRVLTAYKSSFDKKCIGFRLYRNSETVGRNRQLGVDCSTGNIVCFVDGDEILAPNWVETVLDFFEKNKDVELLCTTQIALPKHDFFYKCVSAIYEVSKHNKLGGQD